MTTDSHEAAMRLALAHVSARALHVFVSLGIPDLLFDGPRSAATLAAATSTHELSLLRLLRATAALGLVNEANDAFALTAIGLALCSNATRRASAATQMMGSVGMWRAFGDLTYSVRTGQPSYLRDDPTPTYQKLNGDTSPQLTGTMLAFYGGEPEAILDAYDFSRFATIVDAGGRAGNLLTTILGATPGPRGVIFDLPVAAKQARDTIAERGLAERCLFTGGDFFDSVPAGADAYILSHVINDWPEEKALRILQNVRRAIAANGVLLVIEELIGPGAESERARLLDLVSLVSTGGRHRTAEEHADILQRSGFRLQRIIPTREPVHLVEAVPV
ncbi:MAG TPA: methyltransferase [Thermoanaerobaculia bacterium]|nr:methyltransferase [Thermoanaerobaculia bacterium]